MRTLLHAIGLAMTASLAAQDAGGPCAADEATLYLESEGSTGAVTKRYGWGNTRELEVTARLRTAFPGPGGGVEGYSISVEHTEHPLEILELEWKGLNDIASRGFTKTEAVQNGPRRGFVSAALTCDCSLPPAGDFPLVRARYRVHFGAETLPFLELDARIEYSDGLVGSGQPVRNVLTVSGGSRIPCMESLDVKILVENPDFIRGDANADGVLDISDPVTLLRSQFNGDAVVRCDDAGDSNDDGTLDISDAMYVFNFLFQGGPPPRNPFPSAGWDLTEDELGCFPEATG